MAASVAILLASCEGFTCSNGVVKDNISNKVLDSVSCKVTSRNDNLIALTDSSGAYNVCNTLGGCVSKCKDIIIEFSKPGYKSSTKINPGIDAIILLEKQ